MSLSDPFSTAIDYTEGSPLKVVGSGIYVWEDGDLEFVTMGGQTVGPYAVVAGQLVPFRVKQINAATTAVITVGGNS